MTQLNIDRRFVAIAALAILMLVLWSAIIIRGTYTCPDGHGVFLPGDEDAASIQNICRETRLDKIETRGTR